MQANDIVEVPKDGAKAIRNGLIKVFTNGLPNVFLIKRGDGIAHFPFGFADGDNRLVNLRHHNRAVGTNVDD